MLWSAYYPCRYLRLSSHFRTRQCPRIFRFPVRSYEFWSSKTALDFYLQALHRLRQSAFLFAVPGVIFYQLVCSNLSVERLGEFRSTHTPVRDKGAYAFLFRWAGQDPQVYRYLERFRVA
jgi:hypothetical protein